MGFSAKMNELEAAIGIGNLDLYSDILQKRRDNLYYLLNQFHRFHPYLSSLLKEPYEEIGPHALPIIIEKDAPFDRVQLTTYMEKNGIDTRTLFSSIPTQCNGFEFLGYKLGDFPNAEYIGENGIHVGVHQDLSSKECNYVLEKIETFLVEYL
jgi:dTDP-4-amino-4,6-dideoxygalactose transaminase